MNWTSRYIRLSLWVIYIVVLLELFSYFSSRFAPQLNQLFYNKSVLNENEYNNYILYRDPVLGWPSRNHNFELNGFQPRVEPRFNDHCISLYGDSFTFSAEVESKYSWPNVASSMLMCDVKNFGVPGYGTYQSHLRYTLNQNHDQAKLVILNHLSENINRVKNQYRGFLISGQKKGFKPTASLETSTLQHIPLKNFNSYNDYFNSITNPRNEHFPYDTYLPNKISNFDLTFPYTASLTKALASHYLVKSRINNEPKYAFHYRNDEDLNLILAIMKKFISNAKSNNQNALITIIPTRHDLKYYTTTGTFPYSSLANKLRQDSIEYFDFGVAMVGREDFSNFDAWFHSHDSHPNELGYKIMAKEFVKYITANKVLPEYK